MTSSTSTLCLKAYGCEVKARGKVVYFLAHNVSCFADVCGISVDIN